MLCSDPEDFSKDDILWQGLLLALASLKGQGE
jgi:hypothetical protein